MDYFNHLQKALFAAVGVHGTMTVCMVLAALSMAVVLWAAKPGRTRSRCVVATAGVVLFGVAIVAFDASAVDSRWMQCTAALGTPLVVWCLGRECWKGYLTPWTFSWTRVGLVMLAIWAMGYLIVKATPTDAKEVIWMPYFFTLLLAPLFAFKALLWWTLNTLKKVYLGKFSYEEESTKAVDVYFTTWWNDRVRGRKVDEQDWLELTEQHPQFIDSVWWQKKGLAFWPDVMEWNAKLGTSNMLWFIQQRMESPPEVLDDYSDVAGIWSFTNDAKMA